MMLGNSTILSACVTSQHPSVLICDVAVSVNLRLFTVLNVLLNSHRVLIFTSAKKVLSLKRPSSSKILNIHDVVSNVVQCVLYCKLAPQTWWVGEKSLKEPQTWTRADKWHEAAYLKTDRDEGAKSGTLDILVREFLSLKIKHDDKTNTDATAHANL